MTGRVKVGIRDVAAAAGVSPATVSQVYNEKGEVAEATRNRVRQAGARLGYRPNVIGRALRSGRSQVIGIAVSYRDSVLWESYMPYFQSIIAGAAIEAVEHGYSVSAAPASTTGVIVTRVPLDGVIVIDPVPGDLVVEKSLDAGIAVVADGGYEAAGNALVRSVRYEMTDTVHRVLDHMSQQPQANGSLRPALLVGPLLDVFTSESIAAYRQWCLAHGEPERISVLAPGQPPSEGARALLKSDPEINAVHCVNETYSHAVSQAAAERGRRIPDDVQISVAGNASSVMADHRFVYLNIDPVRSGALCARMLIELLEGRPAEDIIEVVDVIPARTTT